MNKKFMFLPATLLMIATSVQAQAPSAENHGINLEYMDKSVKPGDDFFRFVNGEWFDKTEIPADRTRWGSFDELRQNTDIDALTILKDAVNDKSLAADSDQMKAVNVFKTYLDLDTRNKLGISPIKSTLDQINKIKNVNDVVALLKEKMPEGGLGFFGLYVSADAMDSNKNTIYVSPGSIGLPDRDYYVSDDADSKEKKQKYEVHVARMLQFLGIDDASAKKQAAQVVKLETKMAEARLDRVARRDRRNTYNPMPVTDLQKLTPSVNWADYLATAGLKNVDQVVVSMPKYMETLESIFKTASIDEIKAYMRWTLINKSTGVLTTEIDEANFDFYSKTLTGAVAQRPIEERALQVVNGTVGEALGKLYVEKKFPAEAKEIAKEMVDYVFKAFENRINNLPWMTPATRKGAIEKLHKSTVKIGYPDKWEDYSKLEIKPLEQNGTYYENMKNVARWRFAKNIAEYGKPVDKTKWGMSPQTVNAYFNPTNNEIVFPAAILQPPFYDYKADMAINFGGIGAVIGHEISHGFDDSGSRYNAEGNLVNWWTDDDLKQFTGLGGALADQYSALEPLPNTFVDGKFTLGENIGDLGGVNAAYDGLQLYLKDKGRPENIDGFTPEQRFFISWGTIWRTKMRDEAIKNQVKTDPHAPGMYRSYVPLQNVDAWYEAFDIQPSNKLYVAPEKRVKIW
ncbi:putative endopeptidase [Paenimyroides aquimaris]|uniref:Putative endopeptidase n=1 Tax=Paenimyroides marinum TaxID=1159016 RepID=A0A1H6MC77_9FLAO|nr:putative endopeptidase [Paenimyroides aquimaris]